MKLPYASPRPVPRRSSGDPVPVALIGLGDAARNIHVPACKLLGDVELVAGVDLSEERRDWFRGQMAGAEAFSDVGRMLTARAPEWVIVATPPDSHRQLCVQLLAAGAHVFCEKPIVETSKDAGPIREAAQAAGRRVVVNHEFSRMNIYAKAVELVHEKPFGEPLFVQLWEHLWEQPGGYTGWRGQHLTLREFGTHALDLSVRMLGVPRLVYAQTDSPLGPEHTDLVDVITLTFASGRVASIVLDRMCKGPRRYLEARVDFEQASYRASFGGRVAASLKLDVRSKRPQTELSLCAGGVGWLERGASREVVAQESLNPFAEATARHLAAAIHDSTGMESPTSLDDALTVVRLVETCYESAREGRAIPFSAQ